MLDFYYVGLDYMLPPAAGCLAVEPSAQHLNVVVFMKVTCKSSNFPWQHLTLIPCLQAEVPAPPADEIAQLESMQQARRLLQAQAQASQRRVGPCA